MKGSRADELIAVALAVRVATQELATELMDVEPNLSGACAVASHALAGMLRQRGFAAEFAHGSYRTETNSDHNCHCWVVVDGNLIIDVTATQFGEQALVCVPRTKAEVGKYEIENAGRSAVLLWNQEVSAGIGESRRIRRLAERVFARHAATLNQRKAA